MISVFSNIFQIVCSLFALVISGWLVGALVLVMVGGQTLLMCAFGEALKIKVSHTITPFDVN
jgi:hypothetical protein